MPKPIEVEIRILLKNRRKIEEAIKERGGRIVYFARLIDYWYCPKSAKNYKGASIDKTGFALRIRESEDNYTGKKSVSLECKTLCDGKNHALCHEHEIELKDAGEMRDILKDVGLKEFLMVDKERLIYQIKNIKFCFDRIKGVGDGLEIEVMTTGDIKKAHGELLGIAKKVGIAQSEILEKSLTYLAMEKLSRFDS